MYTFVNEPHVDNSSDPLVGSRSGHGFVSTEFLTNGVLTNNSVAQTPKKYSKPAVSYRSATTPFLQRLLDIKDTHQP